MFNWSEKGQVQQFYREQGFLRGHTTANFFKLSYQMLWTHEILSDGFWPLSVVSKLKELWASSASFAILCVMWYESAPQATQILSLSVSRALKKLAAEVELSWPLNYSLFGF